MGELVLVVEAASLLATLEVALHALGIQGELVDPELLGWQEVETVGKHYLGEFVLKMMVERFIFFSYDKKRIKFLIICY